MHPFETTLKALLVYLTTIVLYQPLQAQGCWKLIAKGSVAYHVIALDQNGSLWASGHNGSGQLGDGTTTQRNSPVKINIVTWQTVAVGLNHTIATKTDGSLWAWGGNRYGQLGDSTAIQRNSPVQIGTGTNWQTVAAGGDHTMATKTDGSLWAWGSNNYGQLGDGTSTTRTSPV